MDHIKLLTCGAFAHLETSPASKAYGCQLDVADACYQVTFPAGLEEDFDAPVQTAHPSAEACSTQSPGEVRALRGGASPVLLALPDGVELGLAVLPEVCVENAVARSSLADEDHSMDGRLPRPIGSGELRYGVDVDNAVVIGTDAASVLAIGCSRP